MHQARIKLADSIVSWNFPWLASAVLSLYRYFLLPAAAARRRTRSASPTTFRFPS